MMESKLNLTYQKKEPDLDAADISLKKPSQVEDDSLHAQFKDGFVKGDAYERPKTFVVIFSGGTVRERDLSFIQRIDSGKMTILWCSLWQMQR